MEVFVKKYYSLLFLLFLVITIGLSFYLGFQEGRGNISESESITFSCPNTVLDKQKISFVMEEKKIPEEDNLDTPATVEVSSSDQVRGMFVGSKNGTKYYTPGCSGTSRIKPENYIWFQSVEDATLQGYSKGSC
ncbi:MAG: hypothetical protein KBC11_00595 [Candidatus Pacebacteria bacterium]|nr:hypothetical protein [Candidatus Paceibacterota bacterium]